MLGLEKLPSCSRGQLDMRFLRVRFVIRERALLGKTNHYPVLGIDPTSTSEQLQQAYHRKANELHPDRHAGSPDHVQASAHKAMSDVNEAFSILGDPIRRKAYDVSLARAQARKTARSGRSIDFGSGPAIAVYLLVVAVSVPVVRAITESGGRAEWR